MPTPEGKRTFSYAEANAALPEVRRLTELAYRKVERLTRSLPGADDSAEREQIQQKVNDVVSAWANALTSEGIDVKGLWLVDFDNGSGYYCWRYPEDGLHYYHSYGEGFPGRMRIQ